MIVHDESFLPKSLPTITKTVTFKSRLLLCGLHMCKCTLRLSGYSTSIQMEELNKNKGHCDHKFYHFIRLNKMLYDNNDSIRSFLLMSLYSNCLSPQLLWSATSTAMSFADNWQMSLIDPNIYPVHFPPLYVLENINGRYIMGFSCFLKFLGLLLNGSCNICFKSMAQSYDNKHLYAPLLKTIQRYFLHNQNLWHKSDPYK